MNLDQISDNDSTDPCGGGEPMIIINSKEGLLSSPGYPTPNSNTLDCSWRIIVDDGLSIQLSFLDFDMEEGYLFMFKGLIKFSLKNLPM